MRKNDRFRSVLIFGGAGFIGSNWAHFLLQHSDAKVHIFDNLSRPGVRHNLESVQKAAGTSDRLQITVGDVRDRAKLERAVRFATDVYHFAAHSALSNRIYDTRLWFETKQQVTFNVLDAVDLMRAFEAVRAVLPKTAGQIYNICGGEQNAVSLLELMTLIEKLTGSKVDYIRDRHRPGDQLVYVTDHSKLTRDSGWRAEVSVAETLERIYAWWKRHRDMFRAPQPEAPLSVALQSRMAG